MDISEVNKRIKELVGEGCKNTYAVLRAELIEFYSTPEGRAEIDHSPQRNMKTEEAVDTLMQGVPARIRREVFNRNG